jgi:NAD(P)-dependent dehydrogenase (short-subunit alcohol dehydrogenase family)
MSRLHGKRALITGGTSGIGLETARQFLAEGARVAITGTNPKTIEAARADLAKLPGGKDVLIIQADAGDVAAQKQIAAQVKDAFGGLDVLFVNAGIADFRPVEQWDEAGFDRSFAVNVKGPYFLIQALLPLFAKSASIVLNTSINAHIGMPNSSIYAATKGALQTFIRTLSGELIGRGIRVNAVSPGPISTPLYGKLGMTEEQLKGLADHIQGQIPAGRFGNPSEVAKAVVFFASDEATFTVGAELTIDGGMSTL